MSALLDSAIRKLYAYVDQRIDSVRPFRGIVTGQSSGMVQIKRLTDSGSGETVLNARVAGFDLETDDEVLVVQIPDWPVAGARSAYVVVGLLQRAAPTGYTLTPDLTVGDLIVKTLNTPMFSRFSQNSADTASSADTSNPVTNFDWTWNLGSDTWTVWAHTHQFCSHSTSGNLVRCQTVVDGSASATALTVGMPVAPLRGLITSESQKTGCTGTITIAAQYRPNTSGTASAGGGTGFALAFRTA